MNTLEKEFVPYQESLELKELGFDEPCFGSYDPFGSKQLSYNGIYIYGNCIAAPTFSQAFGWFREKHKIGTWIHHYFNMGKGNFEYSFVITLPYKDDGYVYEKHEEAELACLKKLIEIANEQK